MNELACECGYAATSPEDLRDHLAEMFTPDDDTAPDGQRHAEAVRGNPDETMPLRCLCGYVADGVPVLDDHLLRAFTPGNQVGRDGRTHVPRRQGSRAATGG